MLTVNTRLPTVMGLLALLLVTISSQSFIKGGQIEKDTTMSARDKDKHDLSKFDCHTCRSTINSFSENLVVTQEKGKGILDPAHLIASIKKRTCQSFHLDFEKEQCYLFLEHHHLDIEEWLRLHRHKNVRMFDYICINRLKLCCFANKFGPNCRDCPPCPRNMVCDGEGTRQGNGTCHCQPGLSGDNCSQCLPGYYQKSTENTNTTNCLKCHRSCKFCRDGGSQGCEVCQTGFQWLDNYGCVDIDECMLGDRKVCGKNTFCVNTEGSHFCYECDRACDGCNGDGPDMCLRCNQHYFLDKGTCHAKKMTVLPQEVNYYRYAIYLGFALCTCIILPYSITMASLVGLAASLYIGVSEYTISNNLTPGNINDFSIDSRKGF